MRITNNEGVKIANNLVSLRTKIKQVKANVANDSIINICYPKGKTIKYKIVTTLFETKRKKNKVTRVRFQLIK